jgi:hypothetical protein
MTIRPGKSNKKIAESTDIVALHTVKTLPDSLEARQKILRALLAACPQSRYAERISVMLEHLNQHQACFPTSEAKSEKTQQNERQRND